MVDYIEKLLHINVDLSPFNEADSLPLYLRGAYEFSILSLAGVHCLLAKPKELANLAILRKQREQIIKFTGMEFIFCFETLDNYKKQKLVSESIPFVIEYRQVFLPFLGIILEKEREIKISASEKFGIMTQRLLLMAIYNNWTEMHLNEIAKRMNVSKMTITRCFNELDLFFPGIANKSGKTRLYKWNKGKKALWELVSSYFVNPVLSEYRLDEISPVADSILGGISAVCQYSMLSDNDYTTYAITKDDSKARKYHELPHVPKGEVPAMVIQVVHYYLPYGDGLAVDPISAVLSLSKEEREDSRVEIAANNILEEVLHD